MTRHSLGIVAALLAGAPGLCPGAVLRVPSEYPTIQAGVDVAAVGDSVLVAPGVYTDIEGRVVAGYFRHACLFLKTGVTVLSEGGPELTVIDMEEREGLTLPHVIFGAFLGSEAAVDGFTVVGSPYGQSAVYVYGGGSWRSVGPSFEMWMPGRQRRGESPSGRRSLT